MSICDTYNEGKQLLFRKFEKLSLAGGLFSFFIHIDMNSIVFTLYKPLILLFFISL